MPERTQLEKWIRALDLKSFGKLLITPFYLILIIFFPTSDCVSLG